MNRSGKLVLCDHPLIQHKLAIIRDAKTGSKLFRELTDEVATLMLYEVTRDLPLQSIRVTTPIAVADCQMLAGNLLTIVPILRAGLGMVDGILKLIPSSRVGHIGLARNADTLQPLEYYVNLPGDVQGGQVIVVDPMLATGGSAIAAIQALKGRGCQAIKLMCLIASPEGIEAIRSAHPDLDLFVAAVDDRLNEHGYIVPGLGDAGDRIFGTQH